MSKPLEDMDEADLKDLMIRCAKAIERELPKPSTGNRKQFALVVFDDPKVAQYVSSCTRATMIEAMRETAERLERKQDVRR